MNCERDVTNIAPDIALQTIYAASLTREGGFMPPVVPLDRVPASFVALDVSLAELGERYNAPDAAVRPWLDELYGAYDPALDAEIDRMTRPELDKLMTALSLLCHAYRWNSNPATPAACGLSRIALPEGLRAPWTRVAERLRCRRVGTLYSVILSNFRMPGRPGGSEYRNEELVGENLELAYNWLLPPHACELRAFLLTFIEVEARGAVAVRVSVPLIQAALREDAPEVSRRLEELRAAIDAMSRPFKHYIRKQMVQPNNFLRLIQPTFGWGLDEGDGPLEGASGTQSGSIQVLDSALGIQRRSEMGQAILRSRSYLPEGHRRFLGVMDGMSGVVGSFVARRHDGAMTGLFNACVEGMQSFRRVHHKRGELYLKGEGDITPVVASTGRMVAPEQDRIAVFSRLMDERRQETADALLAAEPGVPDAVLQSAAA